MSVGREIMYLCLEADYQSIKQKYIEQRYEQDLAAHLAQQKESE